MLTPKQILQVVYIAAALVLGIAITIFADHYQRLKESAVQNVQREGILVNTSAAAIDAELNAQRQYEIEEGLRKAADQFNRRIQEANRNDAPTATRSSAAIPSGLRDAYSERRRARERLGCAGADCPPADAAGSASQRP